MKHAHSQITGTGSFLPPRVVTNEELSAALNTSDSWVREKIGIHERRFVAPGVGPSDLALEASRNALEAAGKKASEVDGILFATATPDYCAPGSGVLLQKKLGCHRVPAWDVHNTSPGFLFALELGDSLIRSGKYSCLLVIGAEVHSTALDLTERGRMMSVIFGDGAGAVVLEPSDGPHGIVATRLHSDGTHFDKLWCEAPGSVFHPRVTESMIKEGRTAPTMDGRFVFEQAVDCMSRVCEELLAENDVEPAEITHVIPHQANLRIIEAVAKKLNIPLDRVALTIDRYGNTSAASIPITLDETFRSKKIQKNDLILMTSFGSGLSWGSALMRW